MLGTFCKPPVQAKWRCMLHLYHIRFWITKIYVDCFHVIILWDSHLLSSCYYLTSLAYCISSIGFCFGQWIFTWCCITAACCCIICCSCCVFNAGWCCCWNNCWICLGDKPCWEAIACSGCWTVIPAAGDWSTTFPFAVFVFLFNAPVLDDDLIASGSGICCPWI